VSEQDWVLFLLVVVGYTASAAWLGRYSVTMPMTLVLAGAAMGPFALDWIAIPASAAEAERITEVTLALLLFADASTVNLGEARQDAGLPRRLLAVGLPLTVLLGAAVAYALFPDEGLAFALLIGAILAPTDAALGLPIFTNPRVPSRIRRALNIESGLNDGIATPLVTLFIAMTVSELDSSRGGWLGDALADIGLGVLVGVVGGFAGGRLFAAAAARHWTTPTAPRIGNLALALAIYWGALAAGGNGFIAAFVGGLVFGAATRYRQREATEFTEETGTAFSTFVWFVFGTALVVPLLREFEARAFVFALLALTVARMVPVAISMSGTGLRRDTVLVMGWLGPRGLASVVFLLIAVEALHEAGREAELLAATASWTIALSVVLHAVSAGPLATWYARRLETAPPDSPELRPGPEVPAHHSPGKHRSFGTHLAHPTGQSGDAAP
jgi:NhaP-type Na+/H+ or K+/H+ antiporter